MTLKYESELLFDLMKRDGDDAPSDVLPYESELKEKYLEQVEGAYPKLQDYQAEWLNYNLYYHLPSYFPVESVTNVTSASFDNVVPYAYKSATLKGSTKYRDIDTGDILDTFDETKNLELVSVQMPVLTTTGKNLLNPVLAERSYPSVATGDNVPFNKNDSTTGAHTSINMFNCEYGKTYTVSVISGNADRRQVFELDENNNILTRASGKSTYTVTNPNTRYLYWYLGQDPTNIIPLDGIQIEEGTQATSYEPFKSNILTVNEDVTLRGIGDVQDTLDCLTGELTERIGEIVIDGSDDEQWVQSSPRGDGIISFQLQINGKQNSRNFTNDKIPNKTSWDEPTESLWTDNSIILTFNKSSLTTADESGLRQRLSQNPITIQYELATESAKTVDLTCINEQGESEALRPFEGTMHVSTSSQTLPPLLDMAVPVEATTQNLMSFANIEEEE